MGNGRVRFWMDKWCGDELLRISFSLLFALAIPKEVWFSSFDGGCWAPRFSRRLNNWDVDIVEWFLLRLQGWRVCRDEEDKLVWTRAKNGKFSVKVLYKELEPGRQMDFPTSVIWNSWVPPKVGIFAWEATWNKILTLDHTQRRGWVVENKCFLLLQRGRIGWPHSHPLWQDKGCMTSPIFSFWCVLGSCLFNERDAHRLAWAFCG